MRARIADWRNRLLANPRFRASAGRIWPFRLLARRRARQLFDISAGFVYSQVLMSCIEVGWFDKLAAGPRSLASLAQDADLEVAAARRLARAAASLELLELRADAGVALGSLGAALVGDPGITAMARHHGMLYADMAKPLALLRGERDHTALGEFWGYATSDAPDQLAAARVAAYSRLMAASQPMIAEQVLAAYDFSKHRHLLDVGGGTGAFVGAVRARYPDLEYTVFDLPGVVAGIDATSDAAPNVAPGSFRSDPLPRGADLISLVRIVHDHDDEVVLGLLRRVREALPDHGTLVIAEPMAGIAGAEPIGDAYFGFYLLAMGSGRARTRDEIDGLLKQCGFGPSRWHATPIPMICSVISTCPV
ncbi:MAG: methyltransferase [Pseudomonadota bacterium]